MKFRINGKAFVQNVTTTLKRKVLSLVSSSFNYDKAVLYAEKVEPFVPKDTGRLRNSYTIVNNNKYVQYNTSYAQKVYTVPARHYTTPGTTHHWDIYANPIIHDDYMKAVNQLANDYFKRTK